MQNNDYQRKIKRGLVWKTFRACIFGGLNDYHSDGVGTLVYGINSFKYF